MASSLVDLVNPLQGTRAVPEFSCGHTLPLVQRPWAKTGWSLVTGRVPWSFHPDLPKLQGIGTETFQLCPQTGPLVTDPVRRASAYRLDKSLVTPYRLKTDFLRYRVTAELAPWDQGAVLRLTWGEGGVSRLLFEGVVPTLSYDRPVARSGQADGVSWVEFDLPRGTVLEVRMGPSDERTLEQLADEGAVEWNRLLGRFEVEGGTEEQRRTFYSCLYRVLCSRGTDVWRTVFPLYALAYRDEIPAILERWGAVAFPEALVAEALSKKVAGVDPDKAWNSLKALVPRTADPLQVSRSLELAYGDWCLAQICRVLKKDGEARLLDDRSKAWQHLFDPSMGFFRPREADGEWTEGFNPLAWGGTFSQGSAWQGGWAVCQDPEGLISALGGPEVALARLDTLLALKPLFHLGTHTQEIHPMTEMAVTDFGQYAHGLPVTHGILWYYALAGRPDKTEKQTRRVLDQLYGPGVDGFCGDENDGNLSAWYLWAALGLYPFCPGSPDYVLGSPLFSKVTIQSGDGRTLVIEAPNNGPEAVYVRKRTLGNIVLTDPRVSHADLFDLGRLVCEMVDRTDRI